MFTLTLSKREKKTARTKKKIKIKTKLNGQLHFQAPSDEGAVVFRRKMTEGEITKVLFLLLSLPQFRYAQQLPRQREPLFYTNFQIR